MLGLVTDVSNAWVRADEGEKHETAPRCQLIAHDRAWLCEAINIFCRHQAEQRQCGHIFRKTTSQRGHFSGPCLRSFQLNCILYSWFGGYLQYIPGSQPAVLTLLSFGNIRICLLRESERLFVSLKISHTFDHDCARLSPPPWSVHLRVGGKEDVHRENGGRTVVYGARCLLSGNERAKKRNITLNAFYQEMKSKGKRIPH